MRKIFHFQNFSKHRRLPLRFFWHCETKKILRKIVIPSLLAKIFFPKQNVSEKHGSPQRIFFHCETKKTSDKTMMLPLLWMKRFSPGIFWNTGGFPCDLFWHCETKMFDRIRDTLPVSPNFVFHNRTFLENKCPATVFFRNVKQIISDKTVKAPLLCLKFFITRNFRNTEGFL